jgi:hypothetical protein
MDEWVDTDTRTDSLWPNPAAHLAIMMVSLTQNVLTAWECPTLTRGLKFKMPKLAPEITEETDPEGGALPFDADKGIGAS